MLLVFEILFSIFIDPANYSIESDSQKLLTFILDYARYLVL